VEKKEQRENIVTIEKGTTMIFLRTQGRTNQKRMAKRKESPKNRAGEALSEPQRERVQVRGLIWAGTSSKNAAPGPRARPHGRNAGD